VSNGFPDKNGAKATVYRIVKQLERKGWLVRVDDGMRNQQTGKYDSTKYRDGVTNAQPAPMQTHQRRK
jgi:hypothetical protein